MSLESVIERLAVAVEDSNKLVRQVIAAESNLHVINRATPAGVTPDVHNDGAAMRGEDETPVAETPVAETPKRVRPSRAKAKPEPAPAPTIDVPAKAQATLADIREASLKVRDAKGIDVAKGMLNTFGAERLSDVPQNKYTDYLVYANKLVSE